MAGDSQWKESISLEETNKIRVSLGLKPISESAPPKDKFAEEAFQKRKDDEAAARDAAALKARIDKARNTKERARRLVGVGLGAAEEGEDLVKKEEGAEDSSDTKAWIKKQKKRAKEEQLLAEKRAKELEERERENLVEYGERDLLGLKVSHQFEDFEEGEETVLTLKDSRVLDDEDDELHNLNISEKAKTAEALALKKKGRNAGQYTGYDDDEFVEGAAGGARSLLKKYDEEIEGKEESGFRLGGLPSESKSNGKGKGKEILPNEPAERNRVKLSMDYTKSFNSDYLQEGEVGFKLKKKKKRAPARTSNNLLGDDSLAPSAPDAMEIDSPAGPSTLIRSNLDDTNLIDDDDLQISLARSRREASRKKVLAIAARNLANAERGNAETVTVTQESDAEDENEDTGNGLILDDTSEFVRNISLAAPAQRPPAPKLPEIKKEPDVKPVLSEQGDASVVPVIKQEPQDVVLHELSTTARTAVTGWGEAREDGEESDDETMENFDRDASMPPPGDDVKPRLTGDDDFGGTGGEALVSKGLAGTLSLLRHQGLIETRSAEELERDRVLKERATWLAAQRKRDEQREQEKRASRAAGSSKDQQQREYENRLRDQRDAEQTLAAFNSYKPNVNLTYHDEFGRDMTQKEAWKQLSHNFHGKTNGSKKTEKRLAKIAAEQAARAMASGDTPLNTASAFAARSERVGSATMILSVGNNNSAPIQEEMLGNLHKSTKKNSTKSKLSTNSGANGANVAAPGRTTNAAEGSSTVFNDIPMRALPVTEAEKPVRKGFAPVQGFKSNSAETGRSQSPMTPLAIPMSVKRKAGTAAEGVPAAKK